MRGWHTDRYKKLLRAFVQIQDTYNVSYEAYEDPAPVGVCDVFSVSMRAEFLCLKVGARNSGFWEE